MIHSDLIALHKQLQHGLTVILPHTTASSCFTDVHVKKHAAVKAFQRGGVYVILQGFCAFALAKLKPQENSFKNASAELQTSSEWEDEQAKVGNNPLRLKKLPLHRENMQL